VHLLRCRYLMSPSHEWNSQRQGTSSVPSVGFKPPSKKASCSPILHFAEAPQLTTKRGRWPAVATTRRASDALWRILPRVLLCSVEQDLAEVRQDTLRAPHPVAGRSAPDPIHFAAAASAMTVSSASAAGHKGTSIINMYAQSAEVT
jgi:hypothetical protein